MNPGPIATRVTSTPSTDNKDAYIESIKRDLLAAENTAKAARHALRAWNREVRKVALEFAPEMFLVLPDLPAPGSVLGDGGFGELAGIPRKRLQDYEINYHSPFSPISYSIEKETEEDGTGFSQLQGQNKLLRATYDGAPVVLKMFLMHDDRQRKALERELSILGRLKNDAIITPKAIVDGCTYDEEIEKSLSKMAVYVEYPHFEGGNLAEWLARGNQGGKDGKKEVKPCNARNCPSAVIWTAVLA